MNTTATHNHDFEDSKTFVELLEMIRFLQIKCDIYKDTVDIISTAYFPNPIGSLLDTKLVREYQKQKKEGKDIVFPEIPTM